LTATDDLETARNNKLTADTNAKTMTSLQLAAEADWNEALAAYGRMAQTKSDGDAGKIGTIGLDVAGTPTPVGPMTAPLNVLATMSEIAGQVDVMWDPVENVVTYIVQVCSDPMTDANWHQVGLPTKSQFTVTGLTTGTKYWFRVAAKGTGAQGPWSDPAQKMAP